MRVNVVRLAHAAGLPLPAYQTAGRRRARSARRARRAEPDDLAPGARALVPTGLIFELPPGYEAQVRPRSGLALKHGVTVLNSPGTIDSDYRGEVRVILVNLGQAPFEIRRGERIAQLVISPVTHATLVEVSSVSNTVRGAGGFGSTGKTAPNENARSRKTAPNKEIHPNARPARKKNAFSKAARPQTLIVGRLDSNRLSPNVRWQRLMPASAATHHPALDRMTRGTPR